MPGLTNPKPWRRWVTIAAVATTGAICAAGAIVASFLFLTDFAMATGWPADWAPLMPLCVDALGATAFLIYGATKDARVFAVGAGAVLASMLGNAASHWFASGWVEPGWLAFTLSGFVPAISIALIIYLLAEKGPELWSATRPQTTAASDGGSTPPAGSSATTTTGQPPTRNATATSGNAPDAASADGGTVLDWSDFTSWPVQALKDRTHDQLLQTIRDQGLASESQAEWVRRIRVSKATAKALHESLATSNDSTAQPLEPANNGHRD